VDAGFECEGIARHHNAARRDIADVERRVHHHRLCRLADDEGLDKRLVLPLDVNGDPATQADAGQFAGAPGFGDRGHEAQHTGVTLHHHFGDSGGGTEAPVDLEGRM